MTEVLGVGVVGCGLAGQAIHLPALLSLPALFRIRVCMDPVESLAAEVAGRVGARATTNLGDVLNDDEVDVVVICSPAASHADQVIQACKAGVRAVLCEKPLADDSASADAIAAAARHTGVPVIVATMHRFDPALIALEAAWDDLPERSMLARSTILAQGNGRLANMVTELVAAPPSPPPTDERPSPTTRDIAAGMLFGIEIHHLPLLRRVVPDPERLGQVSLSASAYDITVLGGGSAVQMTGLFHDHAGTEWSVELWAEDGRAKVSYPQSFLTARSAVAELWAPRDALSASRTFSGAVETGYRAEWRHLHDVVTQGAEPLTTAASAAADVRWVVQVLDLIER